MDTLLKKQTVSVSVPVLDRQEECALSADFVLPEYCPDVAVVLKCLVSPRIQNRQWSGDQLLLDGTAVVRVLYLDEERRCLRQAEFSQPISCTMRVGSQPDIVPVVVDASVKFVNCRAVSPRRLEVRGALLVSASAQQPMPMEMACAADTPALCTHIKKATITTPVATAEKILTISDALDFPTDLPPAEMLLGGDCHAMIQECKLLSGKAIVKGQVHFHQLYTDNTVDGRVYCLDFQVPFSQIMDIEGAEEGQIHTAYATILADTEHCAVGPEGENSVLEVNVKVLLQLFLYEACELPLLLDAYHSGYPVRLEMQELHLQGAQGCQRETATLPVRMELPAQPLSELVDVWVQPHSLSGTCEGGTARLSGRMLVCMLVRDADGCLAYYERPEEYQLEYACVGNTVHGDVQVTAVRYRVIDNCLELQLSVFVTLYPCQRIEQKVLREVVLQTDQPYETERASVKLYYAEPGETVWDIGRSCHTSPEAIKKENDLQEDSISRKAVLIIPMTV